MYELTKTEALMMLAAEQRLEAPDAQAGAASFYVADSTIHGRGVFAGRWFRHNEGIGTYQGLPTQEDDTYVLWLYEDEEWRGIDGTGPLRFLNHSCDPNADFDGCELYALRDIATGEEITFHYGEEWEEGCADAAANPPVYEEEEE